MENKFLVGVKTPIHLFTYSPFFSSLLSGNKIEKWKTFYCSELKHLFTYSPIHLFSPPFCLEIKSKNGKLVLVGVKTPIHLFTYSPFLAYPCLEIKSKIGKLVLVGVKTPIHLFTYSPIHPFVLSFK
jgi:hypothetical protein